MVRIVAEEAASPEDFLGTVLDVSLLLFPEVKAEGYLVGWLGRTPSDGGSIPPAQPSGQLDSPSSDGQKERASMRLLHLGQRNVASTPSPLGQG